MKKILIMLLGVANLTFADPDPWATKCPIAPQGSVQGIASTESINGNYVVVKLPCIYSSSTNYIASAFATAPPGYSGSWRAYTVVNNINQYSFGITTYLTPELYVLPGFKYPIESIYWTTQGN